MKFEDKKQKQEVPSVKKLEIQRKPKVLAESKVPKPEESNKTGKAAKIVFKKSSNAGELDSGDVRVFNSLMFNS